MIKAETAASTGDTVYVKTGTYVEPSAVGGSTGNITFTKAIGWVGKGTDWISDGNVTLQGKSASSSFSVAGNANITSFTNFIFDGQNTASQIVDIKAGHANKVFNYCTFLNPLTTGYTINVRAGGIVTFNNSAFTHVGASGSSIFFVNADAGILVSGSTINKTGGTVVFSSAVSSSISFVNTTMIVSNPDSSVIGQSSTAAPLFITGGSITVTGGLTNKVIYWAGNVTIDGLTANTSSSSGTFLYNIGSTTVALIENSNITHTMSLTTGYGFYNNGVSLTIQDSTLNVTGGNLLSVVSASYLSFVRNHSVSFANNLVSGSAIANSGTGAATINDNTFTITGLTTTLVLKYPVSRVDTGDFVFTNNIVNISAPYQNVINVGDSNCNLTISGNAIDATSLAVSGVHVIILTDVPNPIVTNNSITTESTDTNIHIYIVPSDVTHWLGTGIATITGNNLYSKSHSGYVIALGQDGSSGATYDQRYNGSLIESNTIYGPAYYGDTAKYNTHDIFVGHNINCNIAYNKIIGGSIGFVIKAHTDGTPVPVWTTGGVYDNVVINPSYAAILSKGARNLNIYNNTFYDNASYNPSYIIGIGENLSTYATTGNNVFDNIVYGPTLNNLIQVDTYSTAGFASYKNVYWNDVGSFLSQKFIYNGNNVTGFSAWNSAIGGGDTSILSDPKFIDIVNNNVTLQSISPAIDAGTDVGLTSDYTGTNPIYGAPDIGAYEYQPPHDLTIVTPDTIDIGAGARIYADGKFRDLATTTSVPAKLKIAPSGGSFAAYTGTTARPAWLDVTAITSWTTSHKAWTESNAVAGLTGTVHTIGDLDASRYYTVKKDGVAGQNITGDSCAAGVCLSNFSGQVTFTYTGTYSTHTFDMLELDSAKAITAFSFAGLTPAVTATINGTAITATVPYGTPVIALVPTITITGSSVSPASGVAGNFTTPQTYTVTAADGTTQNYTVTVTATSPYTDATLSNLAISQGVLSPIFASGTTSYADSVANNVASVIVTPTKSQADATIKVNNVTVASGSASGAINLNVGSNTITAAVTAQDGTTTDTYTIIVTRAEDTTPTARGGGANLGLLFLNQQSFAQTPAPTPTPQNNMTPEQRASLVAQIKQQLISLITQVIQMLTLQISQMAR